MLLIFVPSRGANWFALSRWRARLPRRTVTPSKSEQLDYDADGVQELYVTSPRLAALLRPADGATIASLDLRTNGVTLINSMQRRLEAYHNRLRQAAGSADPGRVASIHDQVRAKEEGLERFLQYDRWPRNAFRLLLFKTGKTFDDYRLLKLDEHAALAGGAFKVRETRTGCVNLACQASLAAAGIGKDAPGQILCVKEFNFAHDKQGYRVDCQIEITTTAEAEHSATVGLEIVLNFLAPDNPDRYFELGSGKHPLRWSGTAAVADLPAGKLRVVDEWQDVAATLAAPDASHFWIAPVETVSESEEGFERVYQGSQILAVWPVKLDPGVVWRGNVSLHIEAARQAASAAPAP